MSGAPDLVYLQLTDLPGALSRLAGPLPPGIRLRVADPTADLPLIAELYNASFETSDPEKATPEKVARYGQHAGLSPLGVYLAFAGDLAVGLGVGRVDIPSPGGDPHQGAIELLAVRPGHRRQGIGRALAYALLTWLTSQGVLTVGVSVGDPTIAAVFEKYGFHPA